MASERDDPLSIDWAALPSGFRERFLILFSTGILFTSYLASTVWKVAELSLANPGRRVIFTGDVMSFDFLFAGVLAFVATTSIIYLLHPVSVRRRFGVGRPLDPGSSFGRACSELAQRAKQERAQFLITGNIRQQDAVAFGYPGQRRVCFGGGMRLVAAKDAALGRAVAAHELGHLRHGDVDFGHLSRGVALATAWLAAFTVLVQLTGLGVHLGSPGATQALTNLWNGVREGNIPISLATTIGFKWVQSYAVSPFFLLTNLAFFFVAIYLEYAAVLRSREHYADIYAQSLTGDSSVTALLGKRPERRNKFWKFLRLHPDIVSRRAVIQRPETVLRPFAIQAIASGYIAGIFIAYVTTYTTNIRPGSAGWISYPLPACCNLSEIAKAFGQNPLFFSRVVLFTAVSFLALTLYGSLNLRLTALTSLAIRSRIWLLSFTAILAIAFGVGLVLGEHLNPLAVWRWWNEWPAFGGLTAFVIANPLPIVLLILIAAAVNQLLVPLLRAPVKGEPRTFHRRLLRLTALPAWAILVYPLMSLAPLLKGTGPNWLEAKIASYHEATAKVDSIFSEAIRTVLEGDKAPPDLAAGMYRQALADFESILANYPNSRSAIAIRGGNGNPLTYDSLKKKLSSAECAAHPVRACLMQLAHDEALSELTSGIQAGLPQFGLAAFGSIIAAERALGNIGAARATSDEVLAVLEAKPIPPAAIATSAGALLQLSYALSYVGQRDKGVATYERIVREPPPPPAVLLMRVLSASASDLELLRDDIDALPASSQFFFLADLARQAEDNGLAKVATEKALSVAPAAPQAFYVTDVAVRAGDAGEVWERLGAGLDIGSIPPPWLPFVLRCKAILGDVHGALDSALAISEPALRARALFEIAVVQAERDQKAAKQTVEKADAIADQIAAANPIALWVDAALALVAIEAHARVGDASRAVLMSGKTANRGYRALAFARIACALSKLRHPFLFRRHMVRYVSRKGSH